MQAVAQKQKITNSDMLDKDIIAAAIDGNTCVVQAFFVREGRLIGRDKYNMELAATDTRAEVITDFIKQFYAGIPFVPRQIMVQEELPDMKLLEEWLSGKRGSKVDIVAPKKGQKEKLVELAQKNADMVLAQDIDKLQREKRRTTGAVKEIEELLGIDSAYRMEAYDISNYSSSSMVAGMIVFENGRPLKKAYKRFSIKDNVTQNDYACMQEVLKRRFNEYTKGSDEGFSKLPDLIFLDGGQGHVNAVKNALRDYNIEVPIFGLVKDNKHRTRAISTDGGEIEVSRNKQAFILMTKIQDEVHRFSISYMKSKHTKSSINFELTKVKGIGVKKSQKLMLKYKTIANLKNAGPEDLSETAGVNINIANELYNFIQNEL